MTPSRKALLTCAGALIAVGAAISFVAFVLAGGDVANLSNERRDWRRETHEQLSAAEFARITSIEVSDSETVRVEGYDGDTVVLDCWINRDRSVTVSLRGDRDRLVVEGNDDMSDPQFGLFVSGQDHDTVVRVPRTFSGDVSATSSEGGAAVAGFEGLGDVTVSSESGTVSLSAVGAASATIEGGNGYVHVDVTNVEGTLAVSSANGMVYLNEVVAEDVRAASTNGDVTVNDCTARGSISATSDNGSAVLWRTDAPVSEARSSNGAVEVHLPGTESDYLIDASSQNGECRAPEGNRAAEREVVARSQNGSVLVDLEGSDLSLEETLYRGEELATVLGSVVMEESRLE